LARESNQKDGQFRIGNNGNPFFQVPYTDCSGFATETPFLYSCRCKEGIDTGINNYLESCQRSLPYLGESVLIFVQRLIKNDGTVDDGPMKFALTWVGPNNLRYKLRATINRHGPFPDAGHYTAYVRRAVETDLCWVHCNDEVCSRVNEEEVFDNDRQSTVYALLYERERETMDTALFEADLQLLQRAPELRNSAVVSDSDLRSRVLEFMDCEQLGLQLLARGYEFSHKESKIALLRKLNDYLSMFQD
jgi:hypothetical protein